MIGKTRSGNALSVNSAALIGTHACIIGNTGSGKTHTIRKLLEETWDEAVHIIIDPEREFHTLRQAHPYLIAGGPHADIPADLDHAEDLARQLVEGRHSTIIQFGDHDHLDVQQAFIARFIEALMRLPRPLWRPVFVVIDEAHRYAPQVGAPASLGPIGTLMSQGRKRGFTGILATQRLAKLNKNASSEANTWFVGRVGQVTDLNAAANNLGFKHRSPEALGLRTLAPGQFWCFGVALSNTPVLVQVDPTRTQHLKLGQSWVAPPLTGIEIPRIAARSRKSATWFPPLCLMTLSIIGLVAAALCL